MIMDELVVPPGHHAGVNGMLAQAAQDESRGEDKKQQAAGDLGDRPGHLP